MLVPCGQAHARWLYDRNTGTIRSSDGLCWDIDRSEYRERTRVLAWRCHNGLNQQFVLNN
jgi:hypothetical protein